MVWNKLVLREFVGSDKFFPFITQCVSGCFRFEKIVEQIAVPAILPHQKYAFVHHLTRESLRSFGVGGTSNHNVVEVEIIAYATLSVLAESYLEFFPGNLLRQIERHDAFLVWQFLHCPLLSYLP